MESDLLFPIAILLIEIKLLIMILKRYYLLYWHTGFYVILLISLLPNIY